MTIDTSAWGEHPPEFITSLAAAVKDLGSKAAAAKAIGISRTAVSRLLDNKYDSPSTDKIEKTIMEYCGSVTCPILGELTSDQCKYNRDQPYIATNPQRNALYKACRQCKHNPKRGEA